LPDYRGAIKQLLQRLLLFVDFRLIDILCPYRSQLNSLLYGTNSMQCLFKLVPLILLMALHGSAWSDRSVTLTVQAVGATPDKGQAILSIFDSEDSYLKQPLYEAKQAIDDAGTATFVIEGLRPGNYSVNVIYDEDADGELDTGLFGIPREKIAFSNQARGRFGPPDYNQTRFLLADDLSMEISFIEMGK
jgi:uncharacterized protein (DUF2141 family)